jgi:hypothetical protein
MRRLLSAGLALLLSAAGIGSSVAQPPEAAPGALKLLPGYTHQKEQGRDTRVGKIWKKDGPTIRYDIGRLAGNYAASQKKEDCAWQKEQVIQEQAVQLALTKDHTLFVSFPQLKANFSATIKTDEDLAEVLLIVLTYPPAVKAK